MLTFNEGTMTITAQIYLDNTIQTSIISSHSIFVQLDHFPELREMKQEIVVAVFLWSESLPVAQHHQSNEGCNNRYHVNKCKMVTI